MANAAQKKETSFLHKLDPRTKLILTVFFTILVFFTNTLVSCAVLMFFFILIAFTARLPIKKIFAGWKFLLFLIIFILLMQSLFFSGYGSISLEGFLFGIMTCCRIITIFILMPMLSLTSDMGRLAYGITKLGINYKAAFIITSTLNIIPSLSESMRQCINAYRLRSSNAFKKKSIFSRFKEYSVIAVPVLIKAFRRSALLAQAMDARAFGAYKRRTWVLGINYSKIDFLAYTVSFIFSISVIFLNFKLKG